jgi:hypothetical protein
MPPQLAKPKYVIKVMLFANEFWVGNGSIPQLLREKSVKYLGIFVVIDNLLLL